VMRKPHTRATLPSTRKTNTDGGHVEREDQLGQRSQRGDAILADGERHGAERADGSKAHHDVDHAEHRGGHRLNELLTAGIAAANRKREAKEDGDEQDLEDVSLGEGIHHGCGDDVQQKMLVVW